MPEDQPFFQEHVLPQCTQQEAVDCLIFVEKLRMVRKLGGTGEIIVSLKRGAAFSWKTTQYEHRDKCGVALDTL
jgi:hypothetical protein